MIRRPVVLIVVSFACVGFGTAQPSGFKDRFCLPVYRCWKSDIYKDRPARRLSAGEVEAWLTADRRRVKMFSAGRMVSKSDLSYCATSDSKTLGALLYGKSASRRMLALTEIALRCDRSLKPKVRDNAVKGDLFAYDVFRLLDKTKTSLAALYKEAKPNTLTKAASAYDLLKLGDKRGAQCLDEAMDNPILFRKNHGNGWLDKTNAAFLLICYADGSNRALIAKHLTGPYPTIRRRYPELARLKRPNLDAELLKLTNHEYHGVRKWLAIAAKERPESRAYHRVLEQLSRDSNSEVSAAALWALGKGERP